MEKIEEVTEAGTEVYLLYRAINFSTGQCITEVLQVYNDKSKAQSVAKTMESSFNEIMGHVIMAPEGSIGIQQGKFLFSIGIASIGFFVRPVKVKGILEIAKPTSNIII